MRGKKEVEEEQKSEKENGNTRVWQEKGCIDTKAPVMLWIIRGKAQLSEDVSSPAPSLCPTSSVSSPREEKKGREEGNGREVAKKREREKKEKKKKKKKKKNRKKTTNK